MERVWRVLGAFALVIVAVGSVLASVGTWFAVGISDGLGDSDAPLDGYGLLGAGLALAVVLVVAAIRVARPLFGKETTIDGEKRLRP